MQIEKRISFWLHTYYFKMNPTLVLNKSARDEAAAAGAWCTTKKEEHSKLSSFELARLRLVPWLQLQLLSFAFVIQTKEMQVIKSICALKCKRLKILKANISAEQQLASVLIPSNWFASYNWRYAMYDYYSFVSLFRLSFQHCQQSVGLGLYICLFQ